MILQSTQNQTKTKLYQTDNLQAAILVLSEAFFSLFFFVRSVIYRYSLL